MIPILRSRNALKLDDNGLGLLKEAIKAVVTEERNGKYELSLQYPVSGRLYSQIDVGSLISVKASDTSDLQTFRVYTASRPINGIVTYSCQHISYDLSGFPLPGFTCTDLTAAEAIEKALSEAPLATGFSASTDMTTTNSTDISEPLSVRRLLAGINGSVLDTWGGEYEFDNRHIILHHARGADNGVTIMYAKNLTGLTQESQITETYTHLMPYASYTIEGAEDEPIYVYLSEIVLPLSGASENPLTGVPRALMMDFTDRFGADTQPTEAALRELAESYISGHSQTYTGMRVNLKVTFLPLWQTEDYKAVAPLEHVSLCDTVTVRYPRLGVNVRTKVIKTVYNALTERYDSITLGDPKKSFAAMMSDQIMAMSEIRREIDHPTPIIPPPSPN